MSWVISMINRAALILKYKDPAIKWINDADPYHDNPGITKDDVNDDRTVFLIADEYADNAEILSSWLTENFMELFECELEGWYADESLWPKKRTIGLFHKWFDVECHTMINDTSALPIEDDEG